MVPSAPVDLVVELLADDALGLPAQAVTVEGDRSAEIVYGQGDEASSLALPSPIGTGRPGRCLAVVESNSLPAGTDNPGVLLTDSAWWLDHARDRLIMVTGAPTRPHVPPGAGNALRAWWRTARTCRWSGDRPEPPTAKRPSVESALFGSRRVYL